MSGHFRRSTQIATVPHVIASLSNRLDTAEMVLTLKHNQEKSCILLDG